MNTTSRKAPRPRAPVRRPADGCRQKVLAAVGANLAESDPQRAVQWLDGQRNSPAFSPRAVEGLATAWRRTNPAAADEWQARMRAEMAPPR